MALFSAAEISEQALAAQSFRLSEDAFHLLYERTAHALRGYLRRMLNDGGRADDLLQESYLRLLQAKLPPQMEDDHLKNYLFRIATNLARTELSRRKQEPLADYASGRTSAADVELRTDMASLLSQLGPRQRELLWLAYVEQFTHEEVAAVVGAKSPSIRPMLARARGRLSEILREAGFKPPGRPGEKL